MTLGSTQPLTEMSSMNPPIVTRQRLGKHVPAATNTNNNRGIVVVRGTKRVFWYAVTNVSVGAPCCFYLQGRIHRQQVPLKGW
jgi:hypothetical protein